jgi:hypothetical protein
MSPEIDADMDLPFFKGSPICAVEPVWRASDQLIDGSASPGRARSEGFGSCAVLANGVHDLPRL